MYFPWDLDTTMRDDYDVFTGSVSGGTTVFTDVLFSHWEDDYDAILTEWLAGPLSLEAITGEIDRAVDLSGGDGDSLEAWWNDRHAAVSEQVDAH